MARKQTYKQLNNYEYELLSKIAHNTKTDCWFCIRQKKDGTDYVYDLENRKKMCLKTGIRQLCEALDCRENFDACNLDIFEITVFLKLLEVLHLSLDIDVPKPQLNMNKYRVLEQAKMLGKDFEEQFSNSVIIDGIMYVFTADDRCYSITHITF